MTIQKYFNEIRDVLDRFSATHFILDTNVNFDIRPGDQGYVKGVVSFFDHSTLHFKEFLDVTDENIAKLMYVYHYQDSENRLIFRYDNALHKPPLPYLEHKHLPDKIIKIPAPTLTEVLEEIFRKQNWA